MSRTASRILLVASTAVIVAITYYFMDEFRILRGREAVLTELTEVARDEGPCAALVAARSVAIPRGVNAAVLLSALRSKLAHEIVGVDDPRGARALVEADHDGVIDYGLCEQIRLSTNLGEVHPVLGLLRYTRGGASACDEEPRLAAVLDGLGSHRPAMLHALMRDVAELSCLSSSVAEKVASMIASVVFDAPRLLDDLDVLRVAAFFSDYAPMQAAQFGCRTEVRGQVSLLANAIGCSPDARRRILLHYRVGAAGASSSAANGANAVALLAPNQSSFGRSLQQVAGAADNLSLPVGAEVLLLRESQGTCEISPAEGGGSVHEVACERLHLASDIVIAVRIDSFEWHIVRADLLAGLASFDGTLGRPEAATREPAVKSWFAYGLRGEFLGAAHRVELAALAQASGEALPDRPLRTNCERSGAQYCYDVDWAHTVSRVQGEPVLFLSRPAPILMSAVVATESYSIMFREVFGREPNSEGSWRAYELAGGGLMFVEIVRDGFELRWRGRREGWLAQTFGRLEGGAAPPSARLLAVLDIEHNGIPELIVQRVSRRATPKGVRDASDEILMLRTSDVGRPFTVLNHLTVREY